MSPESQWQDFLEFLWPSRSDPTVRHERRLALLKTCIVIAIFLAAGPEIFAAMEMTALLELLGALLFLTAFSAGVKLVALSVWSAVRSLALPASQVAIVRSGASVSAKTLALIFLTAHATWCLVLVFAFGVKTHWITQVAVYMGSRLTNR